MLARDAEDSMCTERLEGLDHQVPAVALGVIALVLRVHAVAALSLARLSAISETRS